MPSQNRKFLTAFSVFFFFFQNLLCQRGDIDKNPGPKYSSLRFCPWNLNELIAHDCIKITLI